MLACQPTLALLFSRVTSIPLTIPRVRNHEQVRASLNRLDLFLIRARKCVKPDASAKKSLGRDEINMPDVKLAPDFAKSKN